MEMMLRPIICDAVVNFFRSEEWKGFMKQMERGEELRHAHFHAYSILHPEPLVPIVEEYFKARGLPLQRKLYVLPPANVPGVTDIYNIHPKQEWGHAELILQYDRNHILTPIKSRGNNGVEVWDDAYMARYYSKYDFKTQLSSQDERELKAFFDSPQWTLLYSFIMGGPNRHAHSLLETSVHPEIIQKFLISALERRGWEVSRSVSIVYTMRGFDFGKITTLVKKPEVMLELEWAYNPDAIARPGAGSMIFATTLEDLHRCMNGYDYLRLDEMAVTEIIELIKAGS